MTAEEVWALAALAALPGMGPRHLSAVLAEWQPLTAWDAVAAGRLEVSDAAVRGGGAWQTRRAAWAAHAATSTPDAMRARCAKLGISAVVHGAPGYPRRLLNDPDPPLLLFARGDLALADAAAVAIVGTRRATAYGVQVAEKFGHDLAEAGLVVVSGLALGIDGAAHRGALEAAAVGPLAVVGSGLDVVYPARHRRLWDAVAKHGLLVSEAPPGTPPEAWRFPARNRLIAALADLLVVVESPEAGGSMITVDQALERDKPIMAVPGSIFSDVSAGTNRLIFDSCIPALSARDILAHLGSDVAPEAAIDDSPIQATLGEEERRVLEWVGWEPTLLDDVAERCDLPLVSVIMLVERLVQLGEVRRESGFLRRISVKEARGRCR